jgi:cyclophilin family peptidyl-prolyl cis-trans isomerase
MKNNLKPLFSLFAAALLLAGFAGAEVDAKSEKEPETAKETKTMILMKTTKGDIKIELDAEKAPKTVANFLKYVNSGHYNGTIFHRVISNFMIQGGGFTPDMSQKNAPHTVDNEASNGLINLRGTIAMARTSDPHSASAQFFINVKDNGLLDFRAPTRQGWGYCVFGNVTEGMDVVDAIKGVATGNVGPFGDVPKEPIVITEVQIID